MKKYSVPLLLQVTTSMVVEANSPEEAGKKAEELYWADGSHSLTWTGPIDQDEIESEILFPDPNGTAENNGIEEIEDE